jgi:hypothetical protein
MDALFHLPDKGVFGVPEGWRGIQSSNPACYVCCHDSAGDLGHGNTHQKLCAFKLPQQCSTPASQFCVVL